MKRLVRPALVVVFVAVAAAGYALGWWSGGQQPAPKAVTARTTLRYWAAPGLPDVKAAMEAYAAGHQLRAVAAESAEAADVVLRAEASDGAVAVGKAPVGTPVKLAPDSGKLVAAQERPVAYLSVTAAGRALKLDGTALAAALGAAMPNRSWAMTALGDVIIGRSVYMKMLQYDVLHPFDKYAQTLAAPDLTVANLENAFSDTRAVVSYDGMTFVSPGRGAQGLKHAGIDAVNLANNHSYNGGAAGFLDTIATLDGLGVAHFGGGRNAAEARAPYIATVKGVRVAMLGYSSIVGSVGATNSAPGMNYMSMAPWGTLNEVQVQAMEADIRAAKAAADVVLVYAHWGTEYTHTANVDQRTVAHRAVDAGADVILGTHPHWVQGVEWYHDRLITYSLGNFIFDQEWSAKTKQGTVLHLTFDGPRVTSAALEPYTISDYNQPAPATAERAAATLGDIFGASWWPL